MKKFFLTLVVVLCAATAWAAERTVTYTFLAEQSQYTSRWKLTFTRSGTSFNYSTGTKEAIIPDLTNTTGFTVQLDDGLQLTYSRDAGRMTFVGFNSFWLNFQGDDNTHLILSSSHYYVTHVRLATADGDPLIGQASPWTGAGAQMDADVDMVTQTDALDNYRTFDAHITTTQTFARLTVTYADAPRPYAISFNEVEGLTNPNPATYSMTTNTFNIVAPTRTGYDIGAVTYTDALHPNPTAAVLPMNIVRGDAATRKAISFNAAWTAHHYSVSYEANGGSGEMADQDFTYDDAGQALSSNSFTAPTCYHFTGWNTAADGSGTGYADGQQTPNVTATDGATVTLYAQWAINTYKVHYEANGGTGTMDDQDFIYGQYQQLSANAFSREGYTFVGWNAAADGSGEWYNTTAYYRNFTSENNATVPLYAQWAASREVSYIDANGAEQQVTAILINESQTEYGTDQATNWYVVEGEVNLDHLHFYNGFTHLILADGARLTANSSTENTVQSYYLYIYGQSEGTGQLVAFSESNYGIGTGDHDLIINGGSVTATGGKKHTGIDCGIITINGGNVTAIGGENGHGIDASNFTINGGNVTATGGENYHGIDAINFTIKGGNVTAIGGKNGHGIYATYNGITINGGNVTATGGENGYGIYTFGGTTTLAGGTVMASSYYGTVKIKAPLYYTDGTKDYQGTLNNEQISYIAGKTMQPVLRLRDNANNSTAIADNDGKAIAVALSGRTLYKDGDWNTLTLPFDLGNEEAARGHEFDGTPLEGATVKALANSESSGTGYDASTGTLTLYFVDANKIEAGVPYLVKWDKAADYDDNPTDYDITDPVFTGVTVSNEDPAERKVISYDHNVEFRGNYSPVNLDGGDASNLYLGAGNKLYWPSANKNIKSFRAYFHVELGENPQAARNIVMNLGEDSPTIVVESEERRVKSEESDDVIYNLSGQKVDASYKGIVIKNGKKVVQ